MCVEKRNLKEISPNVLLKVHKKLISMEDREQFV